MVQDVITRLIALAIGFALVVAVVPGVEGGDVGAIVLSALIYMVVNATAGRLLKFATAPMALLTLGLWFLVIDAAVLAMTAFLVDGLDIDGFGAFVTATLLLTVVSFLVDVVLSRLARRRGRSRRRAR